MRFKFQELRICSLQPGARLLRADRPIDTRVALDAQPNAVKTQTPMDRDPKRLQIYFSVNHYTTHAKQ